jgi:phosphoglycolate phosphatase
MGMMTQRPLNNRAVIFDFDGTIADSFPVFVSAVAHVLNRKPFSPKEIEELRQYSAREVIKALKINKLKLPWLAAKGSREIDRHQDDITIFKDMREVIEKLYRQGYKLYIVSSHSEKGITLFLERYDMSQYFEHTYGKVGLFGKPRALRKVQARFNHRSEECVFVGDEVRDIEAAKKVGMRCIAVTWGFNPAASLKKHSPNRMINNPGELPKTIKNLAASR